MNQTSQRQRMGGLRLVAVLGCLVVVLLLAVSCAVMINRPKLPAAPLPTPNAADTLAEAAAAIQGIEIFNQSDAAVEEWEDVSSLQDFLASNTMAIEKWELACTQQCVPVVDYSGGLSNLDLTEGIQQFRSASYLPRAAARLAELEDRPLDAAKYYEQLYVMASKYGREGLWLHVMSSMAMQRLALQRLELLVDDLDEESAAGLQRGLANSRHQKLVFQCYSDRDRVLSHNDLGVLRATLVRVMHDPVAEVQMRCEAIEAEIMASEAKLLEQLESKVGPDSP